VSPLCRHAAFQSHSSHTGLPWACAALTIAIYTLLPLAHTAIDGPSGAIGSTLGFIGDLIWLVLAEWWLALSHRIAALGLAVTIGIPFAWAYFKLAGISRQSADTEN
jgi:uncharacterized membrane protein YccF (DUF307 family)